MWIVRIPKCRRGPRDVVVASGRKFTQQSEQGRGVTAPRRDTAALALGASFLRSPAVSAAVVCSGTSRTLQRTSEQPPGPRGRPRLALCSPVMANGSPLRTCRLIEVELVPRLKSPALGRAREQLPLARYPGLGRAMDPITQRRPARRSEAGLHRACAEFARATARGGVWRPCQCSSSRCVRTQGTGSS